MSAPSFGFQSAGGRGAAAAVLFVRGPAWDAKAINARRLALSAAEPATAPLPEGVLIIDDTGDRKDGSATGHAARQHLPLVSKIDNGIVADCFYGDDKALEKALLDRRLPQGTSAPRRITASAMQRSRCCCVPPCTDRAILCAQGRAAN